MEVGFIGLGNMGFPMARRLIREGHHVVAFDTSDAALERIAALGALTFHRRRTPSHRRENGIIRFKNHPRTETVKLPATRDDD
jgi:3-hydroxyisobutyrate dehydrogenase-like beta-hydroxyacid dehydrogenase